MQAQSRGSSDLSHDPFLLSHVHRPDLHQTLRGAKLEELEPRSAASLSLRAIAWRIIGVLAIIGVAWALYLVATQPRARQAIVEWITFGVATPTQSDVGTN